MSGYFILVIISAVILVGSIFLAILTKLQELSKFLISLSMICLMFCGGLGSIFPMQAKKEFVEFEKTREMVIKVVNQSGTYQQSAVVNEKIRLNEWLTSAKASKETYGIFSKYYTLDLDNIGYI